MVDTASARTEPAFGSALTPISEKKYGDANLSSIVVKIDVAVVGA